MNQSLLLHSISSSTYESEQSTLKKIAPEIFGYDKPNKDKDRSYHRSKKPRLPSCFPMIFSDVDSVLRFKLPITFAGLFLKSLRVRKSSHGLVSQTRSRSRAAPAYEACNTAISLATPDPAGADMTYRHHMKHFVSINHILAPVSSVLNHQKLGIRLTSMYLTSEYHQKDKRERDQGAYLHCLVPSAKKY